MADSPSVLNVSHLNGPAVLEHYTGFFDKSTETSEREKHAAEMVGSFYEIVTDFYEYGYGECFHFCPVDDCKSLKESIIDYEKGISKSLLAKPGSKLLVRKKITMHS